MQIKDVNKFPMRFMPNKKALNINVLAIVSLTFKHHEYNK